jgi:polysaccharide export outer membrane protein
MKKLQRYCLLLLLLLSATIHLPAQNETLLIERGDLLHLLVYDTPEMEQHARVTDSGTIPFSFLGTVSVSGLTPAQAAEQIEHRLVAAGVMLHPDVTVRVETYATQNASVMGQVQKPGSYEIDTGRKVVEVLAMAGGLTEYYYSNSAQAALSDDPMVYPGDTVVVPKAAMVYVLGDVSKPGGYPISTNNSTMTVLQAIALAGYANHTASVGKSKLVRATPTGVVEIDLEVNAIEKGKKPDVALLADDVVYVPFSFMRNIGINGQGILASAASAAIYIH